MSRRILALLLTAVMGLSLAACGSQPTEETPAKEWVYVPEFMTIDEENVSYWEMKLIGDSLYYSSYEWDEENETSNESICRYSVADKTVTSVPLTWPADTAGQGINRFTVGDDGSIYVTTSIYLQEEERSVGYLNRFDKDGNHLFTIEIKDPEQEEGMQFWTQYMEADSQGRVYLAGGEGTMLLYDEAGNSKGTLSMGSGDIYIGGMCRGIDGKVYVVYNSYDGGTSSTSVAEIDFDNRALGTSYANFPRSMRALAPGGEKTFLISDGSKVYEYDLEKQDKTELFDWLDCDINGNYVESFGQMEDGRILAVIQDWETNDDGIALLSKVKASEVVPKENITVATLSGGYNLRSYAVKFNKASDKYHVNVKEYFDYNNITATGEDAYMNAYSDAISRLNNDITSNNCPDLVDLSGINVSRLASKGAFEDLNDYLEKSSRLNRSDFMENILDAYTYDDMLISIPGSFTLQTVAGDKSQLGDRKGWTVEDMIAYAEANPGKELFDRVSKSEILGGLLMLNEDSYVDWATGECSFDNDSFKKLLQFVNSFPDEVNWAEEREVTPIRIQNGEVLLYTVDIYDFQSIQTPLEIFKGDAAFIGYPTMDGSVGHAFMGSNAYAIASKAKCKDGAWEFMESVLAGEESSRNRSGFPTVKARLDALIEEVTKIEYATDENGEPYLDENGEPIIIGAGGGMGWGNWFIEFHVPTQEEVDIVLEIMEHAKPVTYSGNDELMKIVLEEAEPFFKGQKSIDEVAGIIQNRVNIYVNENR